MSDNLLNRLRREQSREQMTHEEAPEANLTVEEIEAMVNEGRVEVPVVSAPVKKSDDRRDVGERVPRADPIRETGWGQVGKDLKTMGQDALDILNVGSADMLLYAPQAAVGVGQGVVDAVIPGGDGFKEGYDKPFQSVREARERMPWWKEFAASAMPGAGPAVKATNAAIGMGKQAFMKAAGQADHLAEATMRTGDDLMFRMQEAITNPFSATDAALTQQPGRWRSVAGRVKDEALLGGGAGFISGYIETADLSDAVQQSAVQMLASAGGQAVLGEFVPWLTKYSTEMRRQSAKNGRHMMDRGMGEADEGIRPNSLRNAISDTERPGGSFLELEPAGASKTELVNRVVATVANTTYPQGLAGDTTGSLNDVKRFRHALQTIQEVTTDFNDAMQNKLHGILGDPKSTWAKHLETQGNLAQGRKIYKKITDPNSMKWGGRPISYDKLSNNFNDTYLKALGRKRGGKGRSRANQFTGTTAAMQRDFLDMVRPLDEDLVTNKASMLAAGGPKTNKPGSLGNTTLGNLVDARSRFAAKYLGEGAVIRGIDPKQKREAVKALEAIDELIGDYVGPLGSDARNEFTTYLGQRDQFELGRTIHKALGKTQELPETGKFVSEHIAGLSDDQREALAEGFRSSLAESVYQNSAPVEAMQKIFGGQMGQDVSRDLWFHRNSGNEEVISAILGDDALKGLREIYDEDAVYAETLPILTALLKSKQTNPEAIRAETRDMDEVIISNAFGPGGASAFQNATIGALVRRGKDLGPKQAQQQMDLLRNTGPEMEALLQRILADTERPVAYGGVGSAVGTGVGSMARPEGDDTLGPRDFALPAGLAAEGGEAIAAYLAKIAGE